MPSKVRSPQAIWEQVSSTLVTFVENIFYKLGVLVGLHPWRTVAGSWCFILLSCAGLMMFHLEKNPLKLWVPPDSDYIYDTNWYIEKFGTGFRLQKVLITADNVLLPKVLETVSDITEKVNNIELRFQDQILTLEELCFKVPVIKMVSFTDTRSDVSNSSISSKNKRQKDYVDPYLWLDTDFYCGFYESFPLACLQYNIIDIWKESNVSISNITRQDIVKKINKVKVNSLTGHPVDYTKLLGDPIWNEHGDIVSAKSILLTWYTGVNMSAVDLNEVGNLVGTEDWVSVPLAMWEQKFIELMHSISQNVSNCKIYYEAGRSFADISGEAMFHDIDILFLGIFLMFLYIQFGLSRWNWLEIKLTLGSVGLLCVGMAYITSVSWCSIFNVPFGPVHSSLPFLLMGLGIDDMFVMNACWQNLSPVEKKKPLPVKVGLMLKHAGVSIVITSFTDIVALLIGAITILPSLKSFCLYAACGVFFIFCFSVTFYVAVFTLDLRRVMSNRNGIMFCYKHKNPIVVSQDKTIFQKAMALFYSKIVFTVAGRVIVILFTAVVTGYSIQAILQLEQRFDPRWFIPDGTYYKDFLDQYDYYYQSEGQQGIIFLGEMDYNAELGTLSSMIEQLRNQSYINKLDDWVEPFCGYLKSNFDIDLQNSSDLSHSDFKTYLSKFLFSEIGGKYQVNFKFKDTVKCGNPAPEITASSIMFNFNRFSGPEQYIPAMNNVKDLVKKTNISTGDGYRSVWCKSFANWVTDEVISLEVERNLELALICVMVCTVILITNIQMCLWIFICVLLTIVNVLGFMQRWGMTVDIVCCIGLELAIGLCVDYAAHVGHTFLTTSQGSRTERAFKTITSIGNAVLLGGGSTLISLSLLSFSKAYTFQSFFKIFLLVISFGLFSGLLFLPVMLSLVGPSAYAGKNEAELFETEQLNGKRYADKELDDIPS